MQTEVSSLPLVCSDGCVLRLTRKIGEESKIAEASIKNQSACKSAAILLAKRKQLHPLLGGPYYKNSARVYTLTEPARSLERNPVGQRVLSAKMLRLKQLQNQLTDAHYHLNELTNENRLLKALQKRQDSALQRYEGTNAELPRIINSHHEELRVLQTKYKKLKAQHKETCDLLKEKENELHALQAQNKHLLQLSKDRNLGEREKLQGQVSDLNHRIKRQNETIQMLHRKLALEGKSLKHQLNNEVAKNKAAQRHLNKTMEKLKGLEDLLDNREKKLYYSGQLPIFGKRKNMASQSLINLAADGSNSVNLVKATSGNINRQDNEISEKSLPILAEYVSDANSKLDEINENLTMDSILVSPKTETMASLEQIRKFRLQKSALTQKLSARERLRERINEAEFGENENTEESNSRSEYCHDRQDMSGYETELLKSEPIFEKRKEGSVYRLPKQLKKEFGYSTSESESEDDNIERAEKEQCRETDVTTASKELHARLTNTVEGKESSHERVERTLFTEEELEKFVSEKLKFRRESFMEEPKRKALSKAECKAEMKQLKVAAGISESDSETDAASERLNEQDKFDFILKNAPEEAESENTNHPNEYFSKFDNRLDSDSETDKSIENKKSLGLKSLDVKSKSSSNNCATSKNTNNEMFLRSPDNKYESGKQRLMDITKSWSELQEKIMKERETSENQIKALESELDDDIILETKNVQRLDNNDVKILLNSANLSTHLGANDNFKQNIEQQLFEIDQQSKRFKQQRRNSISLENMSLGTEPSENVGSKVQSLDTIENKELQLIEPEESMEKNKTSMDKDSGIGDNFASNIEKELNEIDETQAVLQTMVLENKKQINESLKAKSKASGPAKVDNIKKRSNSIQHELLFPKKDKCAQKEIPHKEEMSSEAKMISYNKEKLLAAMKAIDNNENVEFLDLQKSQRGNGGNRSQITENLYRGVPTHAKKKDDLMKELFGDGKSDTKSRNGCTKMH